MVARLSASDPGVRWDRLLFCAKEAVYFEEAVVSFDPAGRGFEARLPGPLPGFAGRWATGGGLILTAVTGRAGRGTF